MRKIKINAEHSKVKTLGRVQQAMLFATKSPTQSKTRKMVQFLGNVINTRKEIGTIVKRQQQSSFQMHSFATPAAYSAAMALANILFPKNFPQIIATGLKSKKEQHSSITYSKQVPLTPESQKAIDSFYYDIRLRKRNPQGTAYHKYSEKYKKEIRKAAMEIEKSGLVINDLIMNVGIRKDGPERNFVFFEVVGVDIPKMRTYILALPKRTPSQILAKAQAEKLFEFIESQDPNKMRVSTHLIKTGEIRRIPDTFKN